MDRFFIDLEEASSLILKTIVDPHSGISIFKMGNPVKILDIVNRLIKKAGIPIGYKIIGSKQGEKITEELFTSQEKQSTVDFPEYSFSKFTRYIDLEEISIQDYSSEEHSLRAIENLLKNSNEI
jgi:FlaA1/EpsC-like NDP-sugar epimerase